MDIKGILSIAISCIASAIVSAQSPTLATEGFHWYPSEAPNPALAIQSSDYSVVSSVRLNTGSGFSPWLIVQGNAAHRITSAASMSPSYPDSDGFTANGANLSGKFERGGPVGREILGAPYDGTLVFAGVLSWSSNPSLDDASLVFSNLPARVAITGGQGVFLTFDGVSGMLVGSLLSDSSTRTGSIGAPHQNNTNHLIIVVFQLSSTVPDRVALYVDPPTSSAADGAGINALGPPDAQISGTIFNGGFRSFSVGMRNGSSWDDFRVAYGNGTPAEKLAVALRGRSQFHGTNHPIELGVSINGSLEVLPSTPIVVAPGDKFLLRAFSTHPVADGFDLALGFNLLSSKFVPTPSAFGSISNALWLPDTIDVIRYASSTPLLGQTITNLGAYFGTFEVPQLFGNSMWIQGISQTLGATTPAVILDIR